MPHVIVKLYSGRTEEQKQRLSAEISRAVVEIAGCAEKSISVAIVDVHPDDWMETVYKPDILESRHPLYKKPGYDPLNK